MSTYIWKPATHKGPVFLAPDSTQRSAPTIVAGGKTFTGRYLNTNEGRHQYVFEPGVLNLQGATLNYGGQSTKLDSTNNAYEGSSLGDGFALRSGNKGGIGGGGAGGIPGATGGGSTLGTANPFYDPNFPAFQNVTPNPVSFPSIKTAPYTPIDVTKFGSDFAKTNGALFGQNFSSAQGYALRSLDTELQGLKQFAPGAADVSRSLVGKDNPFNQAERTAQLDFALPGVRGQLDAQGRRAETYAEGRLPDPLLDRALELGVRSGAADEAAFAGFGAGSAQSNKISDLMSAEERLNISQYGEGLLGQNIGERANLELAPTEYANTGSQVRVMPTLSGSQLTGQYTGDLNSATLVSPGQALSTAVQQNQFGTTLEENNRQFNATGQYNASVLNSSQALQADEFNSSGQFTAALGKFGYDVSYLNALQTANQGALNNALGSQVAGTNAGTFNSGLGAGQVANTITGSLTGIGAISAAAGGVSSILGGGATAPSSAAPSAGSVPSGGTVGSSTAPTPILAASSDTGAGGSPDQYQYPAGATGPDGSVPSALRFGNASQVPAGYTSFSNSDGGVSAVPSSAIEPQMAQLAKFANIPSGNVDTGSIIAADKALTDTAALSYIPIKGFQPVALTATGGTVYSLPAAASNGNATLGRDSVQNAALTLAHLGISDPAIYQAMGHVADIAGDPAVHAQLDNLSAKEGPEAVGKAIADRMKDLGVSSKTKAGQQVLAGAMKLGQIWDNLSPAQKSLGLSSLTNPAVETHSGKSPGEQIVPGTDKSVAGPLKVKDVISFTSKGANGFSLARNWNDISAIAAIASGASSPRDVASVAGKIGLTGFGPSGSAVPVTAKQLASAGGRAAPQFGVGAVKFAKADKIPSSYAVISKTPSNEAIAVPRNLKGTSSFSASSISPLIYKKSEEIAAGKHPAQKLWGRAPTGRVIRNSIGGSALVSGLDVMHKVNPTMFSGVAAHAFFNNLIESENAA